MSDDELCDNCEGEGRVFDYDLDCDVICELCNGEGGISFEENERKVEK